jgi:hypothetical protein
MPLTNPFFLFYAVVLASVIGTLRPAVPQTRQADNTQFVVLSSAEISLYRPYTHYAGAAYCPPEQILTWNCGGELFGSFVEVPRQ